jgi:hypothetical protein
LKATHKVCTFDMFIRRNSDGLTNLFLDMTSYIASAKENICLVAIDFAGLTTDPNDLYNFVR